MFEVGFVELLVIFVLGLLILGPERLPRVAAQIGRWVGRARRAAMDLRRQLEREVDLHEHMRSGPRPSPPPRSAESQAGAPPTEVASAEDSAPEASRAAEEAPSIVGSPGGAAEPRAAATAETPQAGTAEDAGAQPEAPHDDAPPDASHESAERRVSAQNGR